MTYRVSINRDALDKGEPRVVLIEHPDGRLFSATTAELCGDVVIGRFDSPRSYGARVGLLADQVYAADAEAL